MKKTILAALLSALALPVLATDYYVVVPVPNRIATTGNILVTLNAYTLPTAVAGRAYGGFDFNSVLQVKGDPAFNPAGVTWSVVGGALPEGLSLSPAGKLTGTPAAAGTSSIQLQASYKTKTGQQGYRVVVGEVTVALAAATLPAGVQGAAYSYDVKPLLSVAGDPQYTAAQVTWSYRGSLPPGLQLNTDGTITGTPTAGGTASFEVLASYLGKSGANTYQVLVGDITVSLAGATPPTGVLGQAYPGFDLKPRVSVAGDAAYPGAGTGVGWSVLTGALPAGMTLDAGTGVVAGTPTARGAGPVTVKAAYKGATATQDYAFTLLDGVRQYSGYRAWTDGTLAASCKEYRNGKPGYAYGGATGDGVYRIDVDGAGPLTPFDVECDMTTDGGGWTLFQRRVNGSVNFYRTYALYASGFGSTTEYWLGNDRLAAMTATGTHSMRVDLTRTTGETSYALYDNFKVADASDAYRLSLTWVGGPAGDSLTRNSGSKFTAYDVDNDTNTSSNCAQLYKGGWWYDWCHLANLNGPYLNGTHTSYADGMEWYTWTGYYESMAKTAMKIRQN